MLEILYVLVLTITGSASPELRASTMESLRVSLPDTVRVVAAGDVPATSTLPRFDVRVEVEAFDRDVAIQFQAGQVTRRQDITFRPEDSLRERGRSIGYLIASMVPVDRMGPPSTSELALSAPESPQSEAPQSEAPQSEPPQSEPPQSEPRRQSEQAEEMPPAFATSEREADAMTWGSRWHGSVDGYLSAGIGTTRRQERIAVGGGAQFSWHFDAPISLLGRVDFRIRQVDMPNVSANWLATAVGLGWRPLRRRRFTLTVAADIGASRDVFQRLAIDEDEDELETVRTGIWSPVVGTRLEARLRLRPTMGIGWTLGVDTVLQDVELLVDGEPFSLPRARLYTNLGIVVGF